MERNNMERNVLGWRDIAGYATLVTEILNGEGR